MLWERDTMKNWWCGREKGNAFLWVMGSKAKVEYLLLLGASTVHPYEQQRWKILRREMPSWGCLEKWEAPRTCSLSSLWSVLYTWMSPSGMVLQEKGWGQLLSWIYLLGFSLDFAIFVMFPKLYQHLSISTLSCYCSWVPELYMPRKIKYNRDCISLKNIFCLNKKYMWG